MENQDGSHNFFLKMMSDVFGKDLIGTTDCKDPTDEKIETEETETEELDGGYLRSLVMMFVTEVRDGCNSFIEEIEEKFPEKTKSIVNKETTSV